MAVHDAHMSTGTPPHEEDVRLGRRIRWLRTGYGQSLADVARGSGLNESFLSRLERGQTGVTLESLRRIAEFWKLEVIDLLQADDNPPAVVVRAGTGPPMKSETTGDLTARSETLIPRPGSALQATLCHMDEPGQGLTHDFTHSGEEVIHVISGEVDYYVGAECYRLTAGDSIWHRSEVPHRWTSVSERAVTLHVNTPPAW